MIKNGYKETEIGVIPVEWEVVKLETICDVRDGTHDSPKYQKKGIPFITSKHLTDNGIDFNNVNYISNENHINFSKRSLVENGDILFGMIGTIGKPLIVNYNFEFSIKNVALLKFKNNIKLNNFFTLNLLKSTIIDKQFSKLSNGGVQSFIALGMIRSLKIPLPPLKEQEKIADILSTADKKIDAIEEQIQKAEILKKGLLQKLLSGKCRVCFSTHLCSNPTYKEGVLGNTPYGDKMIKNGYKETEIGVIPEDWEVVELKNILTIGSGKDYKHLEKGDIPVYGTGGFMLSVNKYLYNGESVCIGRKGTIDKPMFLKGKFWTVDTLFYTHSFKGIKPNFLYYSFLQINWKKYNEASGVPSLSKKTIEAIKIKLPPIKEQKQIANILSMADKKIEILKTKKEKYQELKKGLSQKLLNGKCRVCF